MPAGAGDKFGSYKLIAPLGKGGMGTVWRAIREGADFEQVVAVKLLREGLADDLADRFRRERRILGQLNHPYIARIIDGGTENGVPYIVMEYIDGQPLVAYADAQKLDLRERIAIFRMVCEAVQHAHQQLIVHRDLKPANILVTASGTPKLLDFGIAKILASGSPEESPTQTLTTFMAMTPDYASPEQVRGEPVSTATDIYSLGAILYELLTAARPHGLTNYDAAELVEKICETDTIAPSKRGLPALRGDLDTIVLKAMNKDIARRYVSADQLSEDLHRYLDGRPVLARPDTLRYRAAKYARRNRWGIVAVAAVLLALSAGLLVAQHQARIAKDRFEMVRGLADKFVFDIHDEIAKVDGTTKAREMVVSTGLQYLDQLAASAGSDLPLLEDLTRAYGRIGDVQGKTGGPNLGQLPAATVSYQKALDIAEKLYRQNPAKYAYTAALAETSLARNFWDREQDDDAQKHLQRGIDYARKAEENDPESEKIRILTASNESLLGSMYYSDIKVREALREYDAADQHWQQIVGRNPSPANRLSSASAAESLARLKQTVGDLDAAKSALERARDIVEAELARAPSDPRLLRHASLLYQYLHSLYINEGRPGLDDAGKAWGWRQKSSAITARLVAKDPNNQDAKDLRAADDTGVGSLLALLNRGQEAIPVLNEGLILTRELQKASSEVHSWDTRESDLVRWLALAHSELGHRDLARQTAAEGVGLAERDWKSAPDQAPGQLFVMNAYRMQALVAVNAHDFKLAHAALDRGAKIAEQWRSSTQHEIYFAVGLSDYYQSYAALARAEGDSRAEQEALGKIRNLWQTWPEQSGYTRMRQANPTQRYPW